MKILVVDNYDSFTYNLVQLIGEAGGDGIELEVVRNDVEPLEALLDRAPDRAVISPGPCTPAEAGVSVDAMRRFPEAGIPTLGVCLGHQSLAQAFGGRVVRHVPVHGKTTTISHDGGTLYAGVDDPMVVGRYHSLVVEESTLPDCFEITSRTVDDRDGVEGGMLMSIRHRELPVEGVQFHPESVLTPSGRRLLANFLAQSDAH